MITVMAVVEDTNREERGDESWWVLLALLQNGAIYLLPIDKCFNQQLISINQTQSKQEPLVNLRCVCKVLSGEVQSQVRSSKMHCECTENTESSAAKQQINNIEG
jgi:hypothetical protein